MLNLHSKYFIKNKINLIVIIFFFIFIITFFYLTNILFNEYQFIDNHLVIRIHDSYNQIGFIDTFKHFFMDEFKDRFRPLAATNYLMQIYFFKTKFILYYFYNILIVSLTAIFTYFGLRNLNFSKVNRILFLIIIYTGVQSEILWKISLSENIGLLFYMLSFYLITSDLKYRNSLFVLFAILCSWTKESFTCALPSLIYFDLFLNQNTYSISRLIYNFKKKKYLYLLCLVFILNVSMSLLIGTNNLGYAGIQSDTNLLIDQIILILNTQLLYLIYIFVLIICIEIIYIIYNTNEHIGEKCMEYFKKITFSFILFLLILLPNLYIHAKSGMGTRYLFPTVIGFAFLIISLIEISLNKYLKFIYILVVLIGLNSPLKSMMSDLNKFNQLGNDTKLITNTLRNNLKITDTIILVCDPALNFEQSFSLMHYIQIELKNKNVFFYKVILPSNFEAGFYAKLNSDWDKMFNDKIISDISKQPHIILFFSNDMLPLFSNKNISFNTNYHSILNGIYKKNE